MSYELWVPARKALWDDQTFILLMTCFIFCFVSTLARGPPHLSTMHHDLVGLYWWCTGRKKKLKGPLAGAPWGDILPCQHFISATSLTTTSEKLFPIWRHLPFSELFLSFLPLLDPPTLTLLHLLLHFNSSALSVRVSTVFCSVPTLVNSSLMLSVVPTSL